MTSSRNVIFCWTIFVFGSRSTVSRTTSSWAVATEVRRWDPTRFAMGLAEDINDWLMATTDEFVLAHRQLRSDPRASSHEVKNVKNWFFNNNYPIHGEETHYINTDDDLVSLVPKVRTPLRRFLDLFVCFRLFLFFRVRPVSQILLLPGLAFANCATWCDRSANGTTIPIGMNPKLQSTIATPGWTRS